MAVNYFLKIYIEISMIDFDKHVADTIEQTLTVEKARILLDEAEQEILEKMTPDRVLFTKQFNVIKKMSGISDTNTNLYIEILRTLGSQLEIDIQTHRDDWAAIVFTYKMK